MKKLYQTYREVFWYLVCGAGTTVVNLAVFWCCANGAKTSTAVSTVVAWIFSVCFAYITNRTFVFRSQNRGLQAVLREMGSFFGARVFSGAMDVILMVLLVDMLHLPNMWMKIFVNVLVTVWNFVVSKFFIFAQGKQKSAPAGRRSDNEKEADRAGRGKREATDGAGIGV